jgi:hypothetical protein
MSEVSSFKGTKIVADDGSQNRVFGGLKLKACAESSLSSVIEFVVNVCTVGSEQCPQFFGVGQFRVPKDVVQRWKPFKVVVLSVVCVTFQICALCKLCFEFVKAVPK